MNYNQMMPTRYTLDMDLKTEVTPECLEDSTKKKEATKVGLGLKGERIWIPPYHVEYIECCSLKAFANCCVFQLIGCTCGLISWENCPG